MIRFTVLALAPALLLLAMTSLTFAGDRSVTAAEVNGTWRDPRSKSEIRILALGGGKLKVELALVYEYNSPAGPTSNVGEAVGEATIENDVAVFRPEPDADCKITLTFLPHGRLQVEQEGSECGFGHNVRADGTYRRRVKVGSRK